MAGSFDVSPPELHGAAATLRGARAELSAGGTGAGGMEIGDAGSFELSGAISEFCEQAGQFAAALAEAIEGGATNTDAAAEAYARTDAGAMPKGG